MTVFRILSGLAIAALLGAIAYDLRRRGDTWRGLRQSMHDQAKHAARVWKQRKSNGTKSMLDNLRSIVYAVTAAFFLLLALTGFSPVLFLGDHLSGVLLIIHVTIAPLFALSLSALALLWAHRLRFDEGDWRFVLGLGKRRSPGKEMLVGLALKVGFWLVLFISLPLMLTVILGLFPLFGTEGEALLIKGHGASALLLMLVALAEMYLTIAYVHHSSEHPVKEVGP